MVLFIRRHKINTVILKAFQAVKYTLLVPHTVQKGQITMKVRFDRI